MNRHFPLVQARLSFDVEDGDLTKIVADILQYDRDHGHQRPADIIAREILVDVRTSIRAKAKIVV